MFTNEKEEWKTYVHPDTNKKYSISSLGKVKSKDKEGKEYEHSSYKNNGYRCIPYRKSNGKNGLIYLHKVIADLFVDNPDCYKKLRFLDGNPWNCIASNIKWISPAEAAELNRQQTKPYEIYENYIPNSKISPSKVAIIKKRAIENERTGKTKWTTMAKQFGINTKHLWLIRKGKIWADVEPAK